MSSRQSPQRLGEVLEEVINRLGLRRGLDEARVVEAWAVLAGPRINGVTETAWMKGGVLYVKITSAPWRQELHLRRGQWKKRLNEELGEPLVEEIVFR